MILRYLIAVYGWLLRLYPRSFRDLFADEMQEVFIYSLKENQSHFSRFQRVIREIFTFPGSVTREYWLEYRKDRVFVNQGAGMMVVESERSHRWILFMWITFFSMYCVLLIVPFFVNNLHLVSDELIVQGYFDPKGFAPFDNEMGSQLYILITMFSLLMPVLGIVIGSFWGFRLWRKWAFMSSRQRLIDSIILLVPTFFVLFPLSPLGRVIYVWILD